MAMNDQELHRVVDALQRCVGEPMTGAWQPRRDRVLIGLGDAYLLLVPRGPHARLHTVATRPRNPKRPFSFQGALRAHLRGRLIALTRHPHDRVVDLAFDHGRLHLRLTGRSGGLWLLDEAGVRAAYDGPAPKAVPALPTAPPRETSPRFAPDGQEDWDLAARRYFNTLESQQALEERRARIQRGLRRAQQRATRLKGKLEADLERSERVEEVRRLGDTLAAHLHEVPRGVDQLALPDPMEPDQTVWIPLDPTRSPAANLKAIYNKARRLERMGEHVLERLVELEAQLEAIEGGLAAVGEAEHPVLSRLERLIPPAAASRKPQADLPWATWVGPGGEQVLVGRNASGNRRLTFQRAKGHDFWMHLRGRPGAHLVIPAKRDHPPPLELLLAAAQIALIHGKVPAGVAADVQYTRVRDVRSIPGQADGLVRVDNERVLHVARDPKALAGWVRT